MAAGFCDVQVPFYVSCRSLQKKDQLVLVAPRPRAMKETCSHRCVAQLPTTLSQLVRTEHLTFGAVTPLRVIHVNNEVLVGLMATQTPLVTQLRKR